jgi:hypothetical protein
MVIYILTFAIIIIFYQFAKGNDTGIRRYCSIMCLILTIIVGMRNINLGLNDTVKGYYPRFQAILNHDFLYIFTLKDYGFQILTYIFTRIVGDNFKLYTIAFVFPYMAAVSFLIYKYSSRPWLSYIVFVCLHYFEISYTLMRQVLAMSVLCVSLHFLIEKKYGRFFILVLVATSFHAVSLVFAILLIFEYCKIQKWMIIPLLMIVGVCVLYPKEVMEIAYNLIDYDRFSRYEYSNRTKNLTFFYMNIVMWGAELLAYNIKKNDRSWIIMMTCSSVCLAISPLTIALGEMSRVAYLFGIFHIIILPDMADRMKSGFSRQITVCLVAAFFIMYFLFFLGPQVNIIPYYT